MMTNKKNILLLDNKKMRPMEAMFDTDAECPLVVSSAPSSRTLLPCHRLIPTLLVVAAVASRSRQKKGIAQLYFLWRASMSVPPRETSVLTKAHPHDLPLSFDLKLPLA